MRSPSGRARRQDLPSPPVAFIDDRHITPLEESDDRLANDHVVVRIGHDCVPKDVVERLSCIGNGLVGINGDRVAELPLNLRQLLDAVVQADDRTPGLRRSGSHEFGHRGVVEFGSSDQAPGRQVQLIGVAGQPVRSAYAVVADSFPFPPPHNGKSRSTAVSAGTEK
jgi:hypothetical protein